MQPVENREMGGRRLNIMDRTIQAGLFVVVGIYALVAYIIYFVIGWQNGKHCLNNDAWFDFMEAAFWPIFLPLIISIAIAEGIESWNRSHPQASRRIARVFDLLTLPLRPGSIGYRVARWASKKHTKGVSK